MRTLTWSEIGGIEFPDRKVLDFATDAHEVHFTCDGIFVENEGLIRRPAKVCLRDWQDLKIVRFAHETSETVELSLPSSGRLKEICECSFREHEVTISGFEADSGLWQSYTWRSPQVTVSIE